MLARWWRRVVIRRKEARRRRAWRRLSPEAQLAVMIDYVGCNRHVRRAFREALNVRGDATRKPNMDIEV